MKNEKEEEQERRRDAERGMREGRERRERALSAESTSEVLVNASESKCAKHDAYDRTKRNMFAVICVLVQCMEKSDYIESIQSDFSFSLFQFSSHCFGIRVR